MSKSMATRAARKARLFVFDGETTKPVDLSHDFLLDAVVTDEGLTGLGERPTAGATHPRPVP